MTATAHALIGASIALKVTNPLLGIPIAILSHFIADLIPHWDAGTNHKKKSLTRLKMEAAADVLLGFLLAYLIFWKFVDPEYLFVFKVPPFSWLDWLGHKLQSRMQLPWGLVIQIVVVGLIIYFAFSNSNIFEALAAGI